MDFFFKDKHVYIGLTGNHIKRKNFHLTNKNSPVFKYKQKTKDIPKYIILTEYVNCQDTSKLEKKFIEKYKDLNYILLNKTIGGSLGKSDIIWNKNLCAKYAKNFKTKKDFKNTHNNIYNAAYKNGFLNDICKHMKVLKRPKNTLTKKYCSNIALKYNSKIKFKKNESGVYSTAYKNGWLNDICKHMKRPNNWNEKWTLEKCIIAIKTVNSKSEFRKKFSGAVKFAKKNNYINKVYSYLK